MCGPLLYITGAQQYAGESSTVPSIIQFHLLLVPRPMMRTTVYRLPLSYSLILNLRTNNFPKNSKKARATQQSQNPEATNKGPQSNMETVGLQSTIFCEFTISNILIIISFVKELTTGMQNCKIYYASICRHIRPNQSEYPGNFNLLLSFSSINSNNKTELIH